MTEKNSSSPNKPIIEEDILIKARTIGIQELADSKGQKKIRLEKEMQTIDFILEGKSDKYIIDKLGVQPRAYEAYLSRIKFWWKKYEENKKANSNYQNT